MALQKIRISQNFGQISQVDLAVSFFERFFTCQLFLSQMREIFVFRAPGFPKMFDNFRTLPKPSNDFRRWLEDFRTLMKSLYPISQCVRTRFGGFKHNDIALFIGLCFLTLVRVNIFFESVLVKAVITQIFQPGVRNWSVSVSWHGIEVFNRQAWESHLRCENHA